MWQPLVSSRSQQQADQGALEVGGMPRLLGTGCAHWLQLHHLIAASKHKVS